MNMKHNLKNKSCKKNICDCDYILISKGSTGPTGPIGSTGPKGLDGINGIDGRDGRDGIMGPQGLQGEQGIQGIQGEMGPIGPEGLNGRDGRDGIMGPQGPQGNPGPNLLNSLTYLKNDFGQEAGGAGIGDRPIVWSDGTPSIISLPIIRTPTEPPTLSPPTSWTPFAIAPNDVFYSFIPHVAGYYYITFRVDVFIPFVATDNIGIILTLNNAITSLTHNVIQSSVNACFPFGCSGTIKLQPTDQISLLILNANINNISLRTLYLRRVELSAILLSY